MPGVLKQKLIFVSVNLQLSELHAKSAAAEVLRIIPSELSNCRAVLSVGDILRPFTCRVFWVRKI